MKATLCAILACLLLCGCAAQKPEPTETVPVSAAPSTEPAGSYVPGESLELASGGAVRAYPQDLGNIRAIKAVGDDLLVFSNRDTTTITRLTGENLFRVAEIQLDCYLSPQSPSLYISENQIAYFSADTRELVFLDQDLRETGRMALTEDMIGEPVLNRDRTKIYYCTASGVRCLETETGISRLVKEMSFANQYMTGIHMGDTVLQVETMDGSGSLETLFLDAQTGALLGTLPEGMRLTSGADCFYAIDPEGVVNQMIFGTGEQTWQLVPENYRDAGMFLPELHAAAVFTRDGTMDYYDLATGKRTGSLHLGELQPSSPTVSDNGYLYFLHDGTVICRWDMDAVTIEEETVYTGPWYHFANPDTEGLARRRAYAERLSSQFGVEIELITEAIPMHPETYDLIPEYQVPVIWDALEELEALLSRYPAGMFAASVEGMEDGKLTILLVRDIRAGSVSADGLHFWQENHSMVAIAMDENMEQALHRNLYHALESRLLSASTALYRWDELNPKGFVYDCDLAEIPNRDTGEYFADTTRSFADAASMESPKEDRAAVMAYACMPGKENYFISYTMQKKLRALCESIREAYDLENYPQPLLWEQYLESPIHP